MNIGVDPAPHWANLFFESKYFYQLITKGSPRAYKFYGASRFIDDLCALNDGGECSSSYKYIYPKQLELKLEYKGNMKHSWV